MALISPKSAKAITKSFEDIASAKLEMDKAIKGLSLEFSCFMGKAGLFGNGKYVALKPSQEYREALNTQHEQILDHFGLTLSTVAYGTSTT